MPFFGQSGCFVYGRFIHILFYTGGNQNMVSDNWGSMDNRHKLESKWSTLYQR